MASSFPFISERDKVGDPPMSAMNFENPRLRRFPHPKSLRLTKRLGSGQDGFVFKARGYHNETLAVKIFKPRTPEWYWAFERECVNAALLDMINASLRRAAADGRKKLVIPDPKSREEAFKNLFSFSDEANTGELCEARLVPISADVQITACLGWIEFQGRAINKQLKRARICDQEAMIDEQSYYAIVYEFVPQDELDIDTIVAQHDFFHIIGFHVVPFRESNWQSCGRLVDFSDLVSPHAGPPEWNSDYYARDQESFPRRMAMHSGSSQKLFQEASASITRFWCEAEELRKHHFNI
ncbi:kinetochore sim4 complex subunit FTA2 domain-containing protein [Hirsutella rhossiliensis]|uniref:Kinetochore sim4 complex subunit FTA2 domain-containing protein n=1 Tax=Hirsutella rhossiliensis TaxID=111463 RepID=A0A9P8NAH3_9HYPO|nr:kinetochore sim4 complex subunit FTA2 domain-containing protein [Hirsutella rhossiliensis]KAH0967572.1 kinetochore sim4 complex subunit FTA2 domain-containing protein [Hirsutella rhossiliensis]